ncbi:alpha/beta hydrolase [Lysinibacillus telephonicus]|uniref:Alpha/beta hydrolase n=2 Tax=Lysinibacillus telephonicus TaxID=1714840 RepID=A0A3S0JM19_9BACI|nr:alpha/beta hydrolase [Lysinibacillus telephonicus]
MDLNSDKTIQKTILSSVLQEGFWSRWIAHGLQKDVINNNLSNLASLDGWINVFQKEAKNLTLQAVKYTDNQNRAKAEQCYRLSGQYYNLIQWILPEPNNRKMSWYNECLEAFKKADKQSKDDIIKYTLKVDDKEYIGRIRKPLREQSAIVIIVNPIDSNKEELYTYETDFAEAGFIVLNFDGPGQGETLLIHKHKANKENWSSFLSGVIKFANKAFPGLPINLFGTSSGGAWAIEAGKNPFVSKIVSVSPPPGAGINLPDYFKSRMSNVLEDVDKGFLPDFKELQLVNNIIVFHGLQDVMMDSQELFNLYDQLSPEKRLITYEDEGHCCNFKLPELRQRSINWLKGENINGV